MGIGFGLSRSAEAPSVSRLAPTSEQALILDAFRERRNLVVNAGAGTGKTSTLRMLAGAAPTKRLLYIAYNKAIADDSKASFPSNTECRTAHSLAFRDMGSQYAHRLNSGRVPSWMVAQQLGVQPVKTERRLFTAARAASLVMQMVKGFCYERGEPCARRPGDRRDRSGRGVTSSLPPRSRASVSNEGDFTYAEMARDAWNQADAMCKHDEAAPKTGKAI